MNRFRSDSVYWGILMLPAVIIISIFFIIPVIGGLAYSLTDWNGLDRNVNFIGLDNFIKLFGNDEKFYGGLIHTFVFSICITVFQNIFGLTLALVMDKKFSGRDFFRAAFYLPAVLSPLVIGYTWSFIFNPTMGALNILLKSAGLDFLSADWLGNPRIALFSIIFVVVWQFAGYSMVIYIAGLQSIPQDIYEASGIDGVNARQRFRYITFPLLAPAFTINIVLTMINTLKAFDHIFVMTKGGPGYATEVISTLLYREAFSNNNMGYGSAISVVLFLMIASLSLIWLKFLTKREEYE